jgi:hypothetical protein
VSDIDYLQTHLVVTPNNVELGVASIAINSASQYSVSLPVVSKFPPESYVFCAQTLQFFWHDVNDNAIKTKPAANINFLFIEAILKTKILKLFSS